MNILLLNENDLPKGSNNWRHLVKDFDIIHRSHIIILVKKDGLTYQVIKNRFGENTSIGNFGEILKIENQ